jgi:adenylate cyclase
MNRFYGAATEALLQADALIDKFVGDEVIGLFIPALLGSEHPRSAVEAGRNLLHATGHADASGPWLPVGVGVHTGTAFVGSVGSEVTDITALGDSVNTASRLASEAGPGELLVSEATCVAAGMDIEALEGRQLQVKGREEPVAVRVLRVTPA